MSKQVLALAMLGVALQVSAEPDEVSKACKELRKAPSAAALELVQELLDLENDARTAEQACGLVVELKIRVLEKGKE